jgi:HK97 family phage major capsid protein
MSNVLELREKRAKAWEAAKSFLDAKRDANGLLSAEDTSSYEKMESDVIALGKEIDRLDRQTALDAELSKAINTPIKNKPDSRDDEEKTGRASDAYKGAFWNAVRGKINADAQNALSVGVDTEGGYLAPDEFERDIIEGLADENILRSISHVIQTSSGERKIPIVAAHGEASWVEEGALIPESDEAFGQVTLGAYKLATLIKVSEELMQDSMFNLEQFIAKEFARRIGEKEEEAFFSGDGSGKPTGILANVGGAEVGVTAESPTAITLDNVLDLFYSLKAPYRRKAVFIMNDATIKTIRKLKDSTGQYLWQPSIKDASPDTILNRPLYTSAYMPTPVAGAKTVLFGDFAYYWIADRQGRVFRRLNELYAATAQVGFIATQRVDAKLILPEAVQALKQQPTPPPQG